jgi:chromate reductase
MAKEIHVLGIAGSLRKNSYNKALLREAQQMLPEGMTLEIYDLANIPLFNEDLLYDPPEPVRDFKARLAAADAVLVATPEYNFSIPGVLKNALDWASRPPETSPLNDKPVAMMGASTGFYGTVRAQMHLRQVFAFTNMHVVNRPQIQIQRAQEKFDAKGHLTDEPTRQHVRALLEALAAWTRRLNSEEFG